LHVNTVSGERKGRGHSERSVNAERSVNTVNAAHTRERSVNAVYVFVNAVVLVSAVPHCL